MTLNIKVKKNELSYNLVKFENAPGRKDYFSPSMYFKCQSFVGQAFILLKISIINEWLWFWRINVRLNDDYDQTEILLKHDLCKNISITRGQNSEVIIFNSIKNQSSLNLKQLGGIVFNGEW